MVSFLWGGGRETSHIDYVGHISRRLNTTRQIHQDTTRLSKHTCTPVESRPTVDTDPAVAHLRIGTVMVRRTARRRGTQDTMEWGVL